MDEFNIVDILKAIFSRPVAALDFDFLQFGQIHSRFYFLNILLTLLLIYFIFWQKSKNHSSAVKQIKFWLFNKEYWWNSSTKVDYSLIVINGFLKLFFVMLTIPLGLWLTKKGYRFLLSLIDSPFSLSATMINILWVSAIALILDDALRFFNHLIFHKVSWLWRFHRVHHGADVLTPFTLLRVHPVEAFISSVRNCFSASLSSILFSFLFGYLPSASLFLTVNVFGLLFNLMGSNLRHSDIPLSFGIFEKFFVSPSMHQLHHLKELKFQNCNLGVSLSIWDRMFGSFRPSHCQKSVEALHE